MDYRVNPTIVDGYVVIRTANNAIGYPLEDAIRHGIPVIREDYEFEGWRNITLGNKSVEYVKPNQEVGLFESPEHMPHYSKYGMTDIKMPIKDLEGLVPINMVGKYVSMIANTEQALRYLIYKNYVTERTGFNPVTEAWIAKLLEEGLGPAREIYSIGVENFERKGTAAATYHNGKAILAASKNINEWASSIASRYGLTGPEAIRFIKNFVWQHELFHVFDRRKGRSKDKIEAELGQLLAEFYEEMAQTGKPAHAKYYRALRDFNKWYANEYKEGRESQESLLSISNLEALVDKYASEAERLGLEGKEAKDYVASKLEKEAKAIKSAGRKGKDAKDGKGKNSEAEENGKDNVYEKSELNSEADSDGPSGEG